MKNSLTFTSDHVPDFYIGIKIEPDGTFSAIYNGLGRTIASYLRDRRLPKNNLHSVSIKILEQLNEEVPARCRIRRRRGREVNRG